MSLRGIIQLLQEYLLLGIIVVAFFILLFCVFYLFIYKKLLRGSKSISRKHILLAILTVGYFIILIGAVFLNRHGGGYNYDLQPFNSYLSAWYQWSMTGWRNIILNILLFTPLGFLLPLWHTRFHKLWLTTLCGFLVTLFVETFQLIRSIGVFEVDDLINNTFGCLIGYGIVMICIKLVRTKRFVLFPYSIPILAFILLFGGIFATYSIKELGNLNLAYTTKLDMKNISIYSELNFSEAPTNAYIYKSIKGTKQHTQKVAESIFSSLGTVIDESETSYYDETIFYYSEGRKKSVVVEKNGLTYRFTDRHNDDAHQVHDADEEIIRSTLAKLGIELPKETTFEINENGSYVFTANMISFQNNILNGTLDCEYYSDGTIKSVTNNMILLTPYKEVEMISEAEAYNYIARGNFITRYAQLQLESISINKVELDYMLDSKGFFQPIYRFNSIIMSEDNEYDYSFAVPALK